MKKIILVLAVFISCTQLARAQNQIPQITVNAEGKIKIVPDQVFISVSVETSGIKASEVKKDNDKSVDKVLSFIKKMNLPTTDYSTQQVSLNQRYDYTDRQKKEYEASQTITILLKDLSKYEDLMEGIVEVGVNQIDNVEFKSSKMAGYLIEARKLAIKNAKQKANDYISELPGQKVGKVISINEMESNFYPVVAASYRVDAVAAMDAPRETLAIGELEVQSNVTVSFLLE
jgi:uncharacterized protein YggE